MSPGQATGEQRAITAFHQGDRFPSEASGPLALRGILPLGGAQRRHVGIGQMGRHLARTGSRERRIDEVDQ